MVDVDTFLTELYVMVDDFCKSELPLEPLPGREPSLSRSEVVTVALFSQWVRFSSERDFYRWASRRLRAAFPGLPDRSQFNRLMRTHRVAIVAFGQYLADELGGHAGAYEALDGTGVPVRNVKRRGSGWLAGQADIGWSLRLGWYEGFYLLIAVSPDGVPTGFGFAPASTKDQRAAETFFAVRQTPDPRLPSVGRPSGAPYVADTGFEGRANHEHWRTRYGAEVICPPQPSSRAAWPPAHKRWLASIRQIVETVIDKLQHVFRLGQDRPHDLTGFQARLAAKIALYSFCIWLNRQLGRPQLAFAELIAW